MATLGVTDDLVPPIATTPAAGIPPCCARHGAAVALASPPAASVSEPLPPAAARRGRSRAPACRRCAMLLYLRRAADDADRHGRRRALHRPALGARSFFPPPGSAGGVATAAGAAVALRIRRRAGHARPRSANLSPVDAAATRLPGALRVSNLLTRELVRRGAGGRPRSPVLRAAAPRLDRSAGPAFGGRAARRTSVDAPHALPDRAWRAPTPPTSALDPRAGGRLAHRHGHDRAPYQSGETGALAVFEYSFLLSASFWAWVLGPEAPRGRLAISIRHDPRLRRDHRGSGDQQGDGRERDPGNDA